jgi:hypothetical protein
MIALNDPLSFLDANELEKAFSSTGVVEMDRALTEARLLEFKPVQLVARLAAMEGFVRSEWNKPKPKSTVQPANPKAKP